MTDLSNLQEQVDRAFGYVPLSANAQYSQPASERENPMPGQQLLSTRALGEYGIDNMDRHITEDLSAAKLISSLVAGTGKPGRHKPLLDIDFPAKLFPSSTPGHFHLYLDREMSWEHYTLLLETLATVGIIEEGYLGASADRQATHLRLPWVSRYDA